nr:competence type IV pilus minor pilin ComGE [Streptococcus saliviloxodontae]
MESLTALGLLTFIVSLVLSAIDSTRRDLASYNHDREVLLVARQALQTGQDQLSLNGYEVRVVKQANSWAIFNEGKEVLHVSKK